ncbi:hypothetical protein [Fuerstiella marisgermanici]|uniref:Uncharacterized protein n=1 Tax=Fuerstiella marisgermanici TaxID=1891926 RepID=A0A1P8W8Z7_9PLAN|nr:hypothetical protein [Fuerstiella marisgermanici]APZ90521.1 hypothetical protein Fuma_00100 [Fuerstiella marisgermanici]
MRLLKTDSVVALKRVAQPGLEINIASSEALRLIVECREEESIGLFNLVCGLNLKLVRVVQTHVSVYQSRPTEGTNVWRRMKQNVPFCSHIT